MSRRYWLSVIAAIGLALAGHVDAQIVSDDASGQASAAKSQDRPQADETPLALRAIQDAINSLASAYIAEKNKPKPAEEEDRARRDLRAQENMALWAMLMFIPAAAGVALTFAGVVLIWRTLVHTRRAADAAAAMVKEGENATSAAVEATKAARRQADLAEQSFRRLERPYLLIKLTETFKLTSPIMFGGPVMPSVQYKLVNYGKLPAILRKLSIGLLNNPTFPLSSTFEINKIEYEVIAAGAELLNPQTVEVQNGVQGQGFVGAAITNLYLYGLLEYDDPTGARHADSFLMRGVTGGSAFTVYGGEKYNWTKTEPPKPLSN